MGNKMTEKIELLIKAENRSKILKNIISELERTEVRRYFSTDSKEIENIKNQVREMKTKLTDAIKLVESEEHDNYLNSSEDDDKLTEQFIRNINKVDVNRQLYEEGEHKISTSHILMNQVNIGIHSIGEYFNIRKKRILQYKNNLVFACVVFVLLCLLLIIYKIYLN